MKAEEARNLTEEANSDEMIDFDLSDVYEKIRRAAENGDSSISPRDINFREKARLNDLGYTVKSNHDQRESKSWTTISW